VAQKRDSGLGNELVSLRHFGPKRETINFRRVFTL